MNEHNKPSYNLTASAFSRFIFPQEALPRFQQCHLRTDDLKSIPWECLPWPVCGIWEKSDIWPQTITSSLWTRLGSGCLLAFSKKKRKSSLLSKMEVCLHWGHPNGYIVDSKGKLDGNILIMLKSVFSIPRGQISFNKWSLSDLLKSSCPRSQSPISVVQLGLSQAPETVPYHMGVHCFKTTACSHMPCSHKVLSSSSKLVFVIAP